MSTALEPLKALALVPGLKVSDYHIEAMSGGLTNRVYKLNGEHATYVLRLNAKHTDALGLDRRTEIAILEHASLAGLAPEIVHADVDEGIMLFRYVEGRVWAPKDIAVPENIELLAGLLRRVHELPPSGKAFDAVCTAQSYIDNLRSQPELREFGAHCKSIIESIEISKNICCCHNDVVAENVIVSTDLMLLDWEYACDNEPLFDLASIIAYHELDSAIADKLLSAYAGGLTAELRESLATQIRLYVAVHWLWLASRHVSTPHPKQARRLEELTQVIR